MLNKQLIQLLAAYRSFVFGAYISYIHGRRFGQRKVSINESRTILQMALLEHVAKTNIGRSENKLVYTRQCISAEQLDRLVSNIKNEII